MSLPRKQMDQKVVQWWQGELDRRDARIAELEKRHDYWRDKAHEQAAEIEGQREWQAEAVEFIKTVECQAAYCSAESDTFPSFADAPLCPSCTTQRRGVSSDE